MENYVSFQVQVDGPVCTLPHADVWSGKLFGYFAGKYPRDVDLLSQALGVEASWVEGARPVAELIEEAIVGGLEAPIPLEGKARTAMLNVLRLSMVDNCERGGAADLRAELESVCC